MKKFYILLVLILLTGILSVVLATNKDVQVSEKLSDQKLPRPEDFIQVKRDISKGIYYNLENLSKDYYYQPDFYPSYEPDGKENHDYSRWGVHGYGAYPGEISYNIKNFKKDQYIDVYTFIKASENIETFQGIKFDFDLLHNESDQSNHSDSTQLFDININPNTVMLSPTFPERSEYNVDSRIYDWVYKMKIVIAAKNDIPPGVYEFNLEALPPDNNIQELYYKDIYRINQKWYECPEDKNINCDNNIVGLRKRVYVNGGQFQADKFFKIIINVG